MHLGQDLVRYYAIKWQFGLDFGRCVPHLFVSSGKKYKLLQNLTINISYAKCIYAYLKKFRTTPSKSYKMRYLQKVNTINNRMNAIYTQPLDVSIYDVGGGVQPQGTWPKNSVSIGRVAFLTLWPTTRSNMGSMVFPHSILEQMIRVHGARSSVLSL